MAAGAGIAHEIKNPRNFVNNFSGVSVELIVERDRIIMERTRRGEFRPKPELI